MSAATTEYVNGRIVGRENADGEDELVSVLPYVKGEVEVVPMNAPVSQPPFVTCGVCNQLSSLVSDKGCDFLGVRTCAVHICGQCLNSIAPVAIQTDAICYSLKKPKMTNVHIQRVFELRIVTCRNRQVLSNGPECWNFDLYRVKSNKCLGLSEHKYATCVAMYAKKVADEDAKEAKAAAKATAKVTATKVVVKRVSRKVKVDKYCSTCKNVLNGFSSTPCYGVVFRKACVPICSNCYGSSEKVTIDERAPVRGIPPRVEKVVVSSKNIEIANGMKVFEFTSTMDIPFNSLGKTYKDICEMSLKRAAPSAVREKAPRKRSKLSEETLAAKQELKEVNQRLKDAKAAYKAARQLYEETKREKADAQYLVKLTMTKPQ